MTSLLSIFEVSSPNTLQTSRSNRAFTLIELLVVMALMIVLMTLVAPAITSIAVGSNLTRAGQLVGDQIALARQEAVTSNREIQVIFYNFTHGPSLGWRGIQIWRIDQPDAGPPVTKRLSRMQTIPEGIIISPDITLSPLLRADLTTAGTTTLPGYGSVEYAGFRFRANGRIDGAITQKNNFLTLYGSRAKPSSPGKAPANYYAIQVNPITGKVTYFRP